MYGSMFEFDPEAAWRFVNLIEGCRLFWVTIDLTIVEGSLWDDRFCLWDGFWVTIGSHHFIFHFILAAHRVLKWSKAHQKQHVWLFILFTEAIWRITWIHWKNLLLSHLSLFTSPLPATHFKFCRCWLFQKCFFMSALVCLSPSGQLRNKPLPGQSVSDPVCKIECSMGRWQFAQVRAP